VDVCGTTSEAKDLVAARRYTHFIVDFQIPKDEMSESVKGEGLEFIDHLLPPLGEHNYRPEQILLLTAQSATLKRDFEFKKPIRCEVLAKPGSLKKIEQWIEAGI
jgi:hypothetical protein